MLRRAALGLGLGVGGFVAWDTQIEYSRATRNLRSVAAAVATLYDYKVAVRSADTPEALSAIHDRVAKRWYTVCATNGGLYVKLGQSQPADSFSYTHQWVP